MLALVSTRGCTVQRGRYPSILGTVDTAPVMTTGAKSGQPRAVQLTDPDEYARLYGLAERVYAGYGDYHVKTAAIGRQIPLFRLEPHWRSTLLGRDLALICSRQSSSTSRRLVA